LQTILITGANRGLGLEFVRQYAALGRRVFACCRNPEQAHELRSLVAAHPKLLSLHALDVRDARAIADLSAQLREQPLDLLLNNAGIYGPEKVTVGQIDYAAWAEVLDVNTLSPMRLIEAFLEQVAASTRKTIVCVSSKMGSMGANEAGRHYLYRSSKAALNAVVKSLALDLRPRGITVVTLHPGWVKTDMGGAAADLEIPESIKSVIGMVERLTLASSGRFFNYDGSELPW
jgi:NAD(P)-dependent dehydrogenase (short-subunit alcohol dehydrogenase family)